MERDGTGLHPEATEGEKLEILDACRFRRDRKSGSLIELAITLFAGLPRLTGIKPWFRFESTPEGDLSVGIGSQTGGASFKLPRDPSPMEIADAFALIERKFDLGLRREGGSLFPKRGDWQRPWAFTAPSMLVAMLEEAGIAPGDYLRPVLARTRGGDVGTVRTGDVPAPLDRIAALGRATAIQLPFELPFHAVSVSTRDIALHAIQLSDGASWAKDIDATWGAGFFLAATRLPETLRQAATGMEVKEVVGHPIAKLCANRVKKVVRRGGSTLLAADDSPIPMADPPTDVADRIKRMRDGLLALRSRRSDRGPISGAEEHPVLF